jgi:hypothetical protein
MKQGLLVHFQLTGLILGAHIQDIYSVISSLLDGRGSNGLKGEGESIRRGIILHNIPKDAMELDIQVWVGPYSRRSN